MPTPRKSAKQRKLEGNPGRRPIPKEPDVPALDGSAPPFLTADAHKLWQDYIPRLRKWVFASQLDEPTLVVLCASWGLAMGALRKLKREGLTKDGHKNPAAQIWKDNAQLIIQIGSRFGMTPSDRAKLFVGEKPREEVPQEGDTLDGNWAPSVN